MPVSGEVFSPPSEQGLGINNSRPFTAGRALGTQMPSSNIRLHVMLQSGGERGGEPTGALTALPAESPVSREDC